MNPGLAAIGTGQVQEKAAAGTLTISSVRLSHVSDGAGGFEDEARFQFHRLTSLAPGAAHFITSWLDGSPAGTCLVYSGVGLTPKSPVTGTASLDAGATFGLTTPFGTTSLPFDSGNWQAFYPQGGTPGTVLLPGATTVTGSGGADIGSFSAMVSMPSPVVLNNPASGDVATRADGLKFDWSGASGSDYIQLVVSTCADSACKQLQAQASCLVSPSHQTFTIPAYIMQALPATNFAEVVVGSLSLAAFTASGSDVSNMYAYRDDAGFGGSWGSGTFTLK